MLPLKFLFKTTDENDNVNPYVFSMTDKKWQCYPLCFIFMTTNKKQHCYPLCLFPWRPIRPLRFINDHQLKTTVLHSRFIILTTDKKWQCYPFRFIFMSTDEKQQCYPLCFINDHPLHLFPWRPIKNDSVTPYVLLMITNKKRQFYPYVLFSRRPIKNDSVTPYISFHDDQ